MSDVKSASDWFTITLDQVRLFRALYVGTAGDVSITSGAGTTTVFKDASGILPVSGSKVNTSGTTATDIVGLL